MGYLNKIEFKLYIKSCIFSTFIRNTSDIINCMLGPIYKNMYMYYISTMSAYDLRVPLLLIPGGNSPLPLYTGKTWCLNVFHFLHCGKL